MSNFSSTASTMLLDPKIISYRFVLFSRYFNLNRKELSGNSLYSFKTVQYKRHYRLSQTICPVFNLILYTISVTVVFTERTELFLFRSHYLSTINNVLVSVWPETGLHAGYAGDGLETLQQISFAGRYVWLCYCIIRWDTFQYFALNYI